MKRPIIVVNYKTYKEVTGKRAVAHAKKLEQSSKNFNIIVAAQVGDISLLHKKTKLTIYAQHVDPCEPTRNTGYITAEDVKSEGARGTLLNHSEHRISLEVLKKTLARCKKNNLKTIICAKSLSEAKKILNLKPEMIAFEVPSLIATGNSITAFKGTAVKTFAALIRNHNKKNKTKTKSLCGAGISTAEDIKKALELGCDGVLIASALVKTKHPEKILKQVYA